MAVTSPSEGTNEVDGHFGLKSRILRPWTSNTPRAPFTSANAKLSTVSSCDPSDLESAEAVTPSDDG